MGKHKGFTIVELMIVIIVIAILAAISIVAYIGVQQRARDAALQADIRQAATVVETWLMEPGNSIQGLRDAYGGRAAAWTMGEGAAHSLSENTVYWNDIDGLPHISVGPGTTLEVIVRNNDSEEASNEMLRGHFCMTAQSAGSQYNYVPGTNIHNEYDRSLFYDSKLGGGVKTMDQLVEAYHAGRDMVCFHAARYITAT